MPATDLKYWQNLVRDMPDHEVLDMQALIADTFNRFDTPEFRVKGDALEAELTRRDVDFTPINWTSPDQP